MIGAFELHALHRGDRSEFIAFADRSLYNAISLRASAGKEVSCMRVTRFLEAVGAQIAGYYICKAIDFVVKLLF